MTRYWASILLRHRSLCPFAANDAYIRMHMWLDVCQEIVPRPINCDIQAVKYGSISINIRGWPPQWERFAQSPWVGGRLSLCIVCVCMCVSDMWQLCWQSNYSIYLRNCIEYFFFVSFYLVSYWADFCIWMCMSFHLGRKSRKGRTNPPTRVEKTHFSKLRIRDTNENCSIEQNM